MSLDALTVLSCDECGAAVPLPAAGERAPCAHCGGSAVVPPAYRARQTELALARAALRSAEHQWRELPRPLPLWVAAVAPPAMALGLPVFIVLNVLGWAFWGWYPTPFHMLALGIFTPVFAVIFFGIDLAAKRSYARRVRAMAARRTPEGWACRRCGGPLELIEDSLAASCGYCGADSVLSDPGPRWRRWLASEQDRAERSLQKAVAAVRDSRSNTRVVRIVVLSVLIPFWLLFMYPLIVVWLSG